MRSLLFLLAAVPAFAQDVVSLTTPAADLAATPGQTVPIAGTTTQPFASLVCDPALRCPELSRNNASFSANLVVPADLAPGEYFFSVAARPTNPGPLVFSARRRLSVSLAATPSSLRIDPPTFRFRHVGDQRFVRVLAEFPGGRAVDVTRDPALRLTLSPNLGRRGDELTSLAPGAASLSASLGNLASSVSFTIPNPVAGDLNNDGRINSEDTAILLAYANRPATAPNDAKDIDRNGAINTDDVRILDASNTVLPKVASVLPAVSSGLSGALSFTFSTGGGSESFSVLNILINNALDARSACYLAYSRPAALLFIVPDNGDANQLTPGTIGGAGTLSNSQCSIDLASSSATESVNTLTLTLAFNFSPTFQGNRVIYAAARDLDLNNSGWQTMGVRVVPGQTTPNPRPVAMTPAATNTSSQLYNFSFSEQAAATNLQTSWVLINTAVDARSACYIAYFRPGNLILLFPDDGNGANVQSMALGGTNALSNSQCTVSSEGSSVAVTGSTLTLTLRVSFARTFIGNKAAWLATSTLDNRVSPWTALGALTVPLD